MSPQGSCLNQTYSSFLVQFYFEYFILDKISPSNKANERSVLLILLLLVLLTRANPDIFSRAGFDK